MENQRRQLKMTSISLIIVIVASQLPAAAQGTNDLTLARILAQHNTRQAAVSRIAASGGKELPLLLTWAATPPPDIDRSQLFVGIADAFGQLKAKQAIPFLIQNISLTRYLESDMWMKSPGVIEDRLPAAAALIRIGPEGAKALIHAFWQPMSAQDRRAAIFTISQIGGPDARSFLNQVLQETDFERYLAERGLKGR
jgi:HEAT repeat protein